MTSAPKPRHVLAFEHFSNHTTNHLEASIAFGQFMDAEKKWIDKLARLPIDDDYRQFHEVCLSDHETNNNLDRAKEALQKFGNGIVETKKTEFLLHALSIYEQAAAKGHQRIRWRGVMEATLGAFCWTIALIVISGIASLAGVDLFEVSKRITGH